MKLSKIAKAIVYAEREHNQKRGKESKIRNCVAIMRLLFETVSIGEFHLNRRNDFLLTNVCVQKVFSILGIRCELFKTVKTGNSRFFTVVIPEDEIWPTSKQISVVEQYIRIYFKEENTDSLILEVSPEFMAENIILTTNRAIHSESLEGGATYKTFVKTYSLMLKYIEEKGYDTDIISRKITANVVSVRMLAYFGFKSTLKCKTQTLRTESYQLEPLEHLFFPQLETMKIAFKNHIQG